MSVYRRGQPGGILLALAVVFLGPFDWAERVEAQLRIVSYNTATGNPTGVNTARPGMEIVLAAIGEETINGIARPIDVLLLQEQYSTDMGDDALDDVATQSFVDLMNGIYGTPEFPTPYARGIVDAATSHPEGLGGGPGIVYNTQTIQLIAENRFGTVSGAAQARSTLRYQLRPVGLGSDAGFYVYNSHYKSDSGSDDLNRRLVEATSIRTDPTYGSDALGEGAHVLYVGDFNMQSSNEAAFQALIASGPGQAHDPINRLGSWSENATFADIHTQAPCLSSCNGLTFGGMDDRYDFQLMTGELLDGNGFSYIGPNVPGMSGLQHSYRAFGNNGTTYNDNINDPSNTYPFNGVTSYTRSQILDALHSVSDHLPVVADFQMPDFSPPEILAARWTFETSQPADAGPHTPEQGIGAAQGFHIGPSTYSNPVGNGSNESFSSTNWAIGDYYEFEVSTTGFEDIRVSFDQASSNTGPRDFGIFYATSTSGTFTDTGIAYEVLANASPNPSWNASSPHAEYSYQFDLSDITDLDDQAAIFLRLVNLSTTSANGGNVAGSGTNRVDNVSIFYQAIVDDGLPGDFNDDGSVDAADYVVWRKSYGGDTAAYEDWVTNFGRITDVGTGGNEPVAVPAVPEPAAWLLATVGICMAAMRRCKLTAWTLRQ